MKRGEAVSCERHGQGVATFVCRHLPSAVGAGFFTSDHDEAETRPDAWCVRCEEVLGVTGEWNATGESFARFGMRCSSCYDEIRKRNEWSKAAPTQGSFTCSSCDQIHEGLPRDFAADAPSFTREALARATLANDTCELDGDKFVRVCLEIPIIGGPGPLVYGVWVSLSEESYREYLEHRSWKRRFLDGPYFGWFMNQLEHWPRTLELKTRVHVRPSKLLPVIELEPTDHPLAVAQREGITLERYRELALAHLHGS